MRNLKKLLAVIVAICILATFTIPAFAETAKTDADICADLGVLQGTTGVVDAEYLAKGTTRLQAVIISLRLAGKEEEALAFEGTENFADASDVDWAGGRAILAYVKANPELGWAGSTSGKFFPNEAATPQMIYKVLLEVLGYKQGVDFEWEEAIDFAAEVGLVKVADVEEMTNNDMAIAIVEALKTDVKDGDKTLAETLVEAGAIDEAKAVEAGLYAGELTATFAVTGASKFTVTFNQAVDTAKAKFAVKKGSVVTNIKEVTFAEGKKSAVLEMTAKLTKGDYTITVSGLTDEALSSTVKVEDEKATSIKLLSDTAAAVLDGSSHYSSAKISYAVYNQYGEDITSATTTPSINWTTTIGTADDDNAGVVTLTNNVAPYYTIGQTVNLTGVMTDVAVVVSETIKIGSPASVDSITFEGLYNEDDETVIYSDFADDDFVILLSAKDQYGNDLTASEINANVVVTSTNPSAFAVAASNWVVTGQGADADQLGIQLKAPTTVIPGSGIVRIISKTTGKVFEFPVEVVKAAEVDTFAMSAPSVVIASGDQDVEIPFTAADQNGNAVTAYADLNGKVTFPTNGGSSGTLAFANDYVNKKAKLLYDAPTVTEDTTVILMSLTPSGKTSQITLTIKPAEVAGSIVGLDKDLVTTVAVGGTVTLDVDSFAIVDNYGRDYDITLGAADTDYNIVVEKTSATDDKTTISGNKINTSATSLTITGAKKGSTTYKAYITDDGALVAGSEFTFRVVVVDKADIASYELGDIPTIYDNGKESPDPQIATPDDYKVSLKVYGVMANGTKVAIPESDFDVKTTEPTLTYDSGKLYADEYDFAGEDVDEYTASVIVTVNAAEDAVVLTKTVTVSNAAPAIASIALDTEYANYESEGLITVANNTAYSALAGIAKDAIKAVDQYGVEEANDSYTVVVTNYVPNNGTSTLAQFKDGSVNAVAGDTFNITAITSNGKTLIFKVVVVS